MRALIVRIQLFFWTSPALIAGAWAAPPPPAEADGDSSKAGRKAEPESAADAAPKPTPSSPEEQATALFEQGRALFERGDYEAACPLFEQSLERMPGVGTKFQLAACYEKQGKKARAHALFLDVAKITLEAGQLPRHDVAKRRAEALEADLGALRIHLLDESAGVTVLVGDEAISESKLAGEFFVDPGEYRIVARASGKAEWSKQVTVPVLKLLTIEIPPLEPERAPEPEPQPEPEPTPEPEPALPEDTEPAPNAYTWVPPVALGIGAVGLFTGLAFTQQYRSSNEDAKQVCPSSYACTPEEIERHAALLDDARTARTRAFIGYGVAVAGLAGGVIYYIVRPKAPSDSALRNIGVGPAIDSDSVGGVAYGSF